jgi:uncharacterized protein YodC (DUF2158 family)
MSTFETGDVVCLRTGGPRMVVERCWNRQTGEPPSYTVVWHGADSFERTSLSGVALKLLESAKPEERLPVYGVIRGLCKDWVDGSSVIQKTLAWTILEILKEHGL